MRYVIGSLVLAIFGLGLSGCSTGPDMETDGALSVEAVLRQIKLELGEYQKYVKEHEGEAPLPNVCKGQVNFRIRSLTVKLKTETDVSEGVSAGATIPVGGVGTFGPSLETSSEQKQTQTTTFSIYPRDGLPGAPLAASAPEVSVTNGQSFSTYVSPSGFVGLPIANALEDLRKSVLSASNFAPCYSFTPPPDRDGKSKDQDNNVEFGFNVVRTVKGGGTFKFIIFSLGANGAESSSVSNTITVKFAADPGDGAR